MAKGYVKVTHLQRRRLRYLITPAGISEKAKLAYRYVQVSMNLYRTTRARALVLPKQLRQAGYHEVCIDSDSDLADVCRLTCMEQGFSVRAGDENGSLPRVQVSGTTVILLWPEGEDETPGACE